MKTEPISVRTACEADLPAIAEIERQCFSVPWSEGALADTLHSGYAHLVLAQDGDTVIAYGGIYLLGDDADITNIATLPSHRRRGAASAILSALEDCAFSRGAAAVHLEVRQSNTAAAALYASRGFTVDGIRRNYYKNPTEDAVLMTLHRKD